MAAGQVTDQAVVAQEALAAGEVGADELDGQLHLAEGQQRLLEVDLAEVVPEVGLPRGAEQAPGALQEGLQEVGQGPEDGRLPVTAGESIQVGEDHGLELP